MVNERSHFPEDGIRVSISVIHEFLFARAESYNGMRDVQPNAGRASNTEPGEAHLTRFLSEAALPIKVQTLNPANIVLLLREQDEGRIFIPLFPGVIGHAPVIDEVHPVVSIVRLELLQRTGVGSQAFERLGPHFVDLGVVRRFPV